MKARMCWLVVAAMVGSLMLASCGEKEPPQPPDRSKDAAAGPTGAEARLLAAYEKGADYLRKTQREDGSWGFEKYAAGITGLNVNALALAPAAIREKNKDLIEKGVRYLLSKARPNGAIVVEEGMAENYQTAIAAVALIKLDREKYKDVIDAAVKYAKGIQGGDPSDTARFGAMGYGSDKTKGDIMNTTHAIELLSEAGLSKDSEEFKRALVFLGRTQNLSEYAEEGVHVADDGGAIYRSTRDARDASKAGVIKLPDGTEVPRSYGGATYALLKSLLFMGMEKDHPRVRAAYGWIAKNYSVKEHPEMGAQGLFYYYYTMSRTLELWGTPTIVRDGVEHNWAKELAEQLVSLQQDDGSWSNKQDRWQEGDPTLVTGYVLLLLNICHSMLAK